MAGLHTQAGTSWSNPVWYRGYRIHYGDTVFAAWVFEHDSYDGAEDAGDNRCGYGDTFQECRDQIDEIEDDEDPEPCTASARAAGCICTMSHTHSASIDPPHEIVDPWCPIHGSRDADREYDEMRDRQMEGA